MMRTYFTALLFAALAVAVSFTVATYAVAQPAVEKAEGVAQPGVDKRRSLVGSRPPALTAGRSDAAAPPPKKTAGWFDGVWAWVLYQQQKANRQIVGAVKDLKTQGSFTAAFALIVLSFVYGVLHAAGPGHGKAVISSYVLANERTVRRGIALSFLAALFQALSAIAIITVLVIFMKATSFQIKGAEQWITTLSWGLIAVLGAWLLYTQLRILWRAWRPPATSSECAHHHQHGAHLQSGECCGHAHMPDAQQLENDFSWRKGVMIAASVGVRPCTGAILVLIFALTNGLLWAGIAATFAMALGTAITVSVLASAAVGSRSLITRLAGDESRWGWRIERAAGVLGSFLVFALGASFFAASLGPAAPF